MSIKDWFILEHCRCFLWLKYESLPAKIWINSLNNAFDIPWLNCWSPACKISLLWNLFCHTETISCKHACSRYSDCSTFFGRTFNQHNKKSPKKLKKKKKREWVCDQEHNYPLSSAYYVASKLLFFRSGPRVNLLKGNTIMCMFNEHKRPSAKDETRRHQWQWF